MQAVKTKTKLIVVLGQNASGKSELGVQLAKEFNGEIISADSRQVYKGLDIGSGKITKTEMRGIAHHLLDAASPNKVFTAALYKARAKHAMYGILRRGKLPIVVGGTGFYIDALIHDIEFPRVPPNAALRKKLQKLTTEELVKKLDALDPSRAATIDSKNRRRLIRAIEITKVTGKPAPEAKKSSPYDVLKIGIKLPERELERRIEERLKRRLKSGMVAEVRRLHEVGVSWERLDNLGLEYRYVSRYLRGEISRKEMEEKLKTQIWRFSKRQMTWFKRDKSIIWITRPEKAFPIVRDFLNAS